MSRSASTPSANYRQREASQHANEARFHDAMCVQLSAAYNVVLRNAFALSLAVGAHLKHLSVASFTGNTPCTQDLCEATAYPLRVYQFTASSDEQLRELHAKVGMFISHAGVDAACAAGVIGGTKASNARLLLHVCTRMCPSHANTHNDKLHSEELRSARLRSTVHFCQQHSRFHICDSLCVYQDLTSKETSICALSRVVTSIDSQQFSFGDGVGTRERADKSDQNIEHGLDQGGGALAVGGTKAPRRKRNAATRLAIQNDKTASASGAGTPEMLSPEAAAAESKSAEAKKRQKRIESASKRKKTSKMRGANKPSLIDQAPLVVLLQPSDMRYLPSTLTRDVLIQDARVTLRRVAPFEYRKNGTFDREYALDELRRLHNRERLMRQFMLGRTVRENTFFTDENLLCHHLVMAYELCEYMLFGEQVAAIARQTHERSHDAARRAVQQYIATARKEQRVVVFELLDQIYVEALSNAHTYVMTVLDDALRHVALTYYALLIVEFYFGLLALDVEVPTEDTHAPYATVRKEFSFEYWVPVIVDMMRSGNYMIDNVVVLPRDAFLIGEYCPDSGVMRQLGLSEHMANTLKTLLKQLIEMARRRTPIRVLQATQLPWLDMFAVARRSATPDEAATHTIKAFLAARAARIGDMTRVVQPVDNPHSVFIDLTAE